MSDYNEVYSKLKGKTGLEEDVEKELSKRVAEIEAAGEIVPPLKKVDWVIILALILLTGLLPVVIEGLRYAVI